MISEALVILGSHKWLFTVIVWFEIVGGTVSLALLEAELYPLPI